MAGPTWHRIGGWLSVVSGLASACSAPASRPSARLRYLQDAVYRRRELEVSLVNLGNGYSRLRLEHYATGTVGDWDRLPRWNPATEPMAVAELDAPGAAASRSISSAAEPLALPDPATETDDSTLLALGKAAFERYPVQLAPYLAVALSSRATAQSHGLWLDPDRGVGGLVRARMADGSTALALTCSTCHAVRGARGVEDGRPNALLNLGAAIVEASPGTLDPDTSAAIAAWGPGRVDVTTAVGTEPARIPDLRPVRWLGYLQQDATLVQQDPISLAIRIETLVITSSGQVLRPPRIVALALAEYVRSLADALPSVAVADHVSPRGHEIFDAECSGCHQPPALTGPPVPLAEIGTDPTLGRSADRGTGSYRVPSLHGVGSRGPLLHDGTVPSIDAFFDPARPTPGFTARLHGSGAVPGHPFGLDLSDLDRAALIAYLQSL